MERSEEALRERVRETPLSERLKTCEKYVASMCAERRPPKMTIPLQHYDEDFYIYTTLADAQATIAALQARVRELEAQHEDLVERNRILRHRPDLPVERTEFHDRFVKLQSQLTQRTAELEATEKAYQDKTRLYIEQTGAVADLQAELERVRALIKALPKVEGEIDVSSGVYNFILLKHDSGTRFLCGQIETEQTAKAIAALLQHRQGMEN